MQNASEQQVQLRQTEVLHAEHSWFDVAGLIVRMVSRTCKQLGIHSWRWAVRLSVAHAAKENNCLCGATSRKISSCEQIDQGSRTSGPCNPDAERVQTSRYYPKRNPALSARHTQSAQDASDKATQQMQSAWEQARWFQGHRSNVVGSFTK